MKGMGGGGGGLNLKKARKTLKSTPTKKKLGIGSLVFCTFFIHPNQITNNIGPARQQPRALF